MDTPYIYKFKHKKKKENAENKKIEQNEFSFPDYNIIIGLNENNALFITCEYKQTFYQKILTFDELIKLSEILKEFNNIKDIYFTFLDIIKENKIFVVQFNNNQIKFNLLLNPKKNKCQPIEIPLLRIEKIEKKEREREKDKGKDREKEKNNNDELFERKISDNNVCGDNDFIMIQNNTYDENENVDSVILGFVNNLNSQMQAKKIINEENKTNINANTLSNNKNKKRNKKKNKALSGEKIDEKIDFDNVSEINHNNNNNNNKENKIEFDLSKLYNIINELRNEINFIKDVQRQEMNDTKEIKEIKEIIKTNKKLVNEINDIQTKLSNLNEENIRNKNEIEELKNKINDFNKVNPNANRANKMVNIKSRNNKYKGDNEEYILNTSFDKNTNANKTTYVNIYTNRENRNIKGKLFKKSKTNRNKLRGKSTPHYNKNDSNIRSISMENYIFKQKYKIKEDETEIDLTNEKIGDSGLQILSLIEFEQIQTLSLDDNILYDITPLKNMNFQQLLVLNLDNNQINDLSVLEKVKFYQLQKLWLNNNNITDINVFENVKFSLLQGLWLNNNSIEDISVFERMKLNQLQKIYINNNLIKDIDCLDRIKLKSLTLLSFTNNKVDYNIPKNKGIIANIKEKLSYIFY